MSKSVRITYQEIYQNKRTVLFNLLDSSCFTNYFDSLNLFIETLKGISTSQTSNVIYEIIHFFDIFVTQPGYAENSSLPRMMVPFSLLSITRSGWFSDSLTSYLLMLFKKQTSAFLKMMNELEKGTQESFNFDSAVVKHFHEIVEDPMNEFLKEVEDEFHQQKIVTMINWVKKKVKEFCISKEQYNNWKCRALDGHGINVMDEIETSLHFTLPAGDTEGLRKIERLLIMLQGSQNAVVASRALRLLNAIYDGHTFNLGHREDEEQEKSGNQTMGVVVGTIADEMKPEMRIAMSVEVDELEINSETKNKTKAKMKKLITLVLEKLFNVALLVYHPPQAQQNKQSAASQRSMSPHNASTSSTRSSSSASANFFYLYQSVKQREHSASSENQHVAEYMPILLSPHLFVGDDESEEAFSLGFSYGSAQQLDQEVADRIISTAMSSISYNDTSASVILRYAVKVTPESLSHALASSSVKDSPASKNRFGADVDSLSGSYENHYFQPGFYDTRWVVRNSSTSDCCAHLMGLSPVSSSWLFSRDDAKLFEAADDNDESVATKKIEPIASLSSSALPTSNSESASIMLNFSTEPAPFRYIPEIEKAAPALPPSALSSSFSSVDAANASRSIESRHITASVTLSASPSASFCGCRFVLHPITTHTAFSSAEFPSLWSTLSRALASDPALQCLVDANEEQPPKETEGSSGHQPSPSEIFQQPFHRHTHLSAGGKEEASDAVSSATPSPLLLYVSSAVPAIEGSTLSLPTDRANLLDSTHARQLFQPHQLREGRVLKEKRQRQKARLENGLDEEIDDEDPVASPEDVMPVDLVSQQSLPVSSASAQSSMQSSMAQSKGVVLLPGMKSNNVRTGTEIPSLIIDYLPHASASHKHRRYHPLLLKHMSSTIPLWTVGLANPAAQLPPSHPLALQHWQYQQWQRQQQMMQSMQGNINTSMGLNYGTASTPMSMNPLSSGVASSYSSGQVFGAQMGPSSFISSTMGSSVNPSLMNSATTSPGPSTLFPFVGVGYTPLVAATPQTGGLMSGMGGMAGIGSQGAPMPLQMGVGGGHMNPGLNAPLGSTSGMTGASGVVPSSYVGSLMGGGMMGMGGAGQQLGPASYSQSQMMTTMGTTTGMTSAPLPPSFSSAGGSSSSAPQSSSSSVHFNPNCFTDVVLPTEGRLHALVIQILMGSSFRGPYQLVLHDDDANEMSVLNYRDIRTWDLAAEELELLSYRHGVHGVVYKSPLLFGTTFHVDYLEMMRCDADGVPHYTSEQMLRGDVCTPSATLVPPVPSFDIGDSSDVATLEAEAKMSSMASAENSSILPQSSILPSTSKLSPLSHSELDLTNASKSVLNESEASTIAPSSLRSNEKNEKINSKALTAAQFEAAEKELFELDINATVPFGDPQKIHFVEADKKLVTTPFTAPTSLLPPLAPSSISSIPRTDTLGFWTHLLVLSGAMKAGATQGDITKAKAKQFGLAEGSDEVIGVPAHPFFVKLAKRVWLDDPTFMFVADITSDEKDPATSPASVANTALATSPYFSTLAEECATKAPLENCVDLQSTLINAALLSSGVLPLTQTLSRLIELLFDVFLVDSKEKEDPWTKALAKAAASGNIPTLPTISAASSNESGILRSSSSKSRTNEEELSEDEDEYVDTRATARSNLPSFSSSSPHSSDSTSFSSSQSHSGSGSRSQLSPSDDAVSHGDRRREDDEELPIEVERRKRREEEEALRKQREREAAKEIERLREKEKQQFQAFYGPPISPSSPSTSQEYITSVTQKKPHVSIYKRNKRRREVKNVPVDTPLRRLQLYLQTLQHLLPSSPLFLIHPVDALSFPSFFANFINSADFFLHPDASCAALDAALTLLAVTAPGFFISRIQPGLAAASSATSAQLPGSSGAGSQQNSSIVSMSSGASSFSSQSAAPTFGSTTSPSMANSTLMQTTPLQQTAQITPYTTSNRSDKAKPWMHLRTKHYATPQFHHVLARFYATLLLRRRFPILSTGSVSFLSAYHQYGPHDKIFAVVRHNRRVEARTLRCMGSKEELYGWLYGRSSGSINEFEKKNDEFANKDSKGEGKAKNTSESVAKPGESPLSQTMRLASSPNSRILVALSSQMSNDAFAFIDFSPLRPLFVKDKPSARRGGRYTINQSASSSSAAAAATAAGGVGILAGRVVERTDAEKEEAENEEFEREKQVVVQLRDVSNMLNESWHTSQGKAANDASTPDASLSLLPTQDPAPRFVFLTEFLHDPLYHSIHAQTTQLFSVTLHPRSMGLEMLCLQQSVERIVDLFYYNTDEDAARSRFNFILRTLRRTTGDIRHFAHALFSIGSKLAVIFDAQARQAVNEMEKRVRLNLTTTINPGATDYQSNGEGAGRNDGKKGAKIVGEVVYAIPHSEPALSPSDVVGIAIPKMLSSPTALQFSDVADAMIAFDENQLKRKAATESVDWPDGGRLDSRFVRNISNANAQSVLPPTIEEKEIRMRIMKEMGIEIKPFTQQTSHSFSSIPAPLPSSASTMPIDSLTLRDKTLNPAEEKEKSSASSSTLVPEKPSIEQRCRDWAAERTSGTLQSFLWLMCENEADDKSKRALRTRILAFLKVLRGSTQTTLAQRDRFAKAIKKHLKIENPSILNEHHQQKNEEPQGESASSTNPTAPLFSSFEADKSHSFVSALSASILRFNSIGPIVFVGPELGKWTTVGGLGVMVDELTQDLAANGADVSVISPYYNVDRKGRTGYLAADGFRHLKNIITYVGHEKVECGVHYNEVKGVKLYFIHNYSLFPEAYCNQGAEDRLRTCVLMAKGALELCCQFPVLPSLVVTNDWFAGLCAAYAHRSGAFGTVFSHTSFFHIAHNLEEDYQGRIWPNREKGALNYIHHLEQDILVDPFGSQNVLNLSRAAFMCTDNWGTVSKTYRNDLLAGSSLSPLLRKFHRAFGTSNGVRKEQRRETLAKVVGTMNHLEAKRRLQEKYFPKAVDERIPVFGFVGRLTEQKGVLLILHCCYGLIEDLGGRIQFIIGGKSTPGDPYGDACQREMWELRRRYPDSFWADPNEFFVDGPLVNLGCDYGLMPSLFEPGGIVQMEFFVSGTPVVAFRTGGLKDTVFETGNPETSNGFTFEGYTEIDLKDAVRRAVLCYEDKSKYEQLRKVAWNSVIDTKEMGVSWLSEFGRMRHRMVALEEEVESEAKRVENSLFASGDEEL